MTHIRSSLAPVTSQGQSLEFSIPKDVTFEQWEDIGRHSGIDRVYFVLAASVGLVKIGTSWRLPHRLAELQLMSPVALTLIGSVALNIEVERGYHDLFAVHRSRGEWFKFTDEVSHRIHLDCLAGSWNSASIEARQRFLALVGSLHTSDQMEIV